MTTVQLEYVVAVDTYRSFVTAADKCFVTQPTLSMQIQKLEDELGVKIFDRSKLPVVPTEIGMAVIAQGRVILKESARIREIIADQKKEIQGTLKVGIIPTLAPYLLPRVLTSFMKKYPKVKLEVWEYSTEQIISLLKQEQLDCGLLATPLHNQHLEEHPLFYETFVVFTAKSNKLSDKKVILPEDLETKDIWLLNEGHCMRNQVLNICRDKFSMGEFRNLEYNTGSVETLKRMVELNEGYTILPELSLQDLSAKQMNMVRFFKAPEPVREISLVTHRYFIKQGVIEAFKKEILANVPEKMKVKKTKKVIDILIDKK
ncbi:hydrogen peroxide-inducible genes activator [Chitinophaga niabensis]|uniref:LysR family transcriptional regulator, hydrogen peroxide-inducible genes activator n=1 Tax=Chitinophaga niabensis TaxID=536979 RepID=A0A1N6GE80_9BACT|nr:hydrogen peroxide-inducible genes activator [Chitinophaga niabensis]SIO05712.1 LysR family transcriptional regulator, hydrogen peroxide-inducible genes activator [Chitinophaga niabensis]